jgi:hypothetical protein
MKTAPVWIGIDVAKDHLDVAIGAEGDSCSFRNDQAGIHELRTELSARRCALIVLEATGGFEVAVASSLAAAGLPVVVINPRQVRDFLRVPPVSSPRPTVWMPASWRCSRSAFVRRCVRSPMKRPGCWMPCFRGVVSSWT